MELLARIDELEARLSLQSTEENVADEIIRTTVEEIAAISAAGAGEAQEEAKVSVSGVVRRDPHVGSQPPMDNDLAATMRRLELTSGEVAAMLGDPVPRDARPAPPDAVLHDHDCPVCLCGFDGDEVQPQQLPCNHLVCKACLQQLYQHNLGETCPLCRAKLPPGPETMMADAWTLFIRGIRQSVANDRNVLFQQAIELCNQVLELDPNSAGAFSLQGHCFHDGLGVDMDHAAALPLYTRALKINEAVLGPDHPKTAAFLNNLATLHQAMGNHVAALPLYTRALKIREAAFGPDHP